jgi:hypothetical protein
LAPLELTEEEAAAMRWVKGVEEVGDGPDGPYLVLKDDTVITCEVPED